MPVAQPRNAAFVETNPQIAVAIFAEGGRRISVNRNLVACITVKCICRSFPPVQERLYAAADNAHPNIAVRIFVQSERFRATQPILRCVNLERTGTREIL